MFPVKKQAALVRSGLVQQTVQIVGSHDLTLIVMPHLPLTMRMACQSAMNAYHDNTKAEDTTADEPVGTAADEREAGSAGSCAGPK